MRSSSTDPAAERRFLPAGAGAWVRLALVAMLGIGAVVAPGVERTGAIYTDVEEAELTLEGPPATAAPTEPAAPEPAATEPDPNATPPPTDAATATQAPASLAAPAAVPAPAASDVPEQAPESTAAPTAAPTPATTTAPTTAPPVPRQWPGRPHPRGGR